MRKTLITAAFLVTLVTFPLAQITRLQFPGNIAVTVFDISVLGTGFVWLVLFARRSSYRNLPLAKPIIIMFGVMLVSLAANFLRYPLIELAISSLYAFRWFLIACIYFVVPEVSVQVRRKLPLFMGLAGGIIVILGYIQYFFYPNLRNLYYLGWDEHLLRMFSTFLDPNFLGAFLVCYFLFLLGSLSTMTHSKQWYRIVLSCMSTLTFIAIFLTTSRSAFIMLAVSLCTYLYLSGRKKLIVGFFAIVILILLATSRFFSIENVNPFRITSSLARLETAENAIQVIKHNSILGVGFNAYRYAQYSYGLRTSDTEYPNHADSGTDMSLLFVWATTGIVGLAAFLYLVYTMFQMGKHGSSPYARVLMVTVLGLLVNSLFLNSFFYPLLLYWLFLLSTLTDYT